MADEPQAKQQESAETPEPMPSSEQTPSSDEKASPEKPGAGRKSGEDERSLPEGVKKRTTEQFDKLKKQLGEEREKRLRLERVYKQLPQTQSKSEPKLPDYYNPNTGEVDVTKLQAEVDAAKNEARQAQQAAKRIIQESDRKQEQEAYKEHPDLNPRNDDFNEDLHKAVVGYLANAYAEGQNPSLKDAADKVKSFSKTEVEQAKKQGAKQALEKLTPKEQAAMEADTGRSDRRRGVARDQNELQRRTREGDTEAILARLKNIE